LFSISIEKPGLDIYNPMDGSLLRSLNDLGTTPALLVTP